MGGLSFSPANFRIWVSVVCPPSGSGTEPPAEIVLGEFFTLNSDFGESTYSEVSCPLSAQIFGFILKTESDKFTLIIILL